MFQDADIFLYAIRRLGLTIHEPRRVRRFWLHLTSAIAGAIAGWRSIEATIKPE